ncbi:hypothetical protein ACFLZ6_01365, partial [Nanoarchaeota archaeon]
NTQCNLSTISGTSPITLPNWGGRVNLQSVTAAYVDDYTDSIKNNEWYNITFVMTSASSRAQWTLGAATGYGPFPKSSFSSPSAYLSGPNSGDFTITETSNGFIIDSNGVSLPSGYTVSFLIRAHSILSQMDYELTYAENTGFETSINNQVYAEVFESVPPESQSIQVMPSSKNISYGSSVYLRANISDNNQLGVCDWDIYGEATFNPADSTNCRATFTPTIEGTYYINVTPVDYYSTRGNSTSTNYTVNILPASYSVRVVSSNVTPPFFRPYESLTFNASFNVPSTDALGECQVFVKNDTDNETFLGNFSSIGNECYADNVDISGLSDGLYRIFVRTKETTESDIVESDTTALFICYKVLYGVCQYVDFNEDGEADVCGANFPPVISDPYPPTDTNITEGESIIFNITFSDPERGTIRIRWFLDGTPVKAHYNTSESTSNYTLITDYLSAGTRNITVIVDDGEFFVDHQWLIEVINVNRLPYFTEDIPSITWKEDTRLSWIDLDDYVYDEDTDDILSFSYTYLGIIQSPIVIIIDPATHIISLSQPANWFGTETIYFTVSDGKGGSNRSNNITLTVSEIPEPIPPPPVSYQEACKSQWYCEPWTVCYPNSTRTRPCIDVKECPFPINVPIMQERCTYIPTCYDGIQNQGEDSVDCGGPCQECWTCLDMIQNCHIIEGRVICEEGMDCGGPCTPCPSCFDGIQNQEESGIDCGGPCGVDCCENSFRDINLGEIGVDCGGPCAECALVQPAPPPMSLRRIIGWLLLLILIVLLVALAIKNRERISEAVYKMTLKKEAVIEEDVRGTLLNKLNSLGRSVDRKTREELTKDISKAFTDLIKTLLKIDYEFTHEELIMELGKSGIEIGAKKIIMSFSEDMSKIKYSGYKLTKEEARSLIDEMKVITELSTKKKETPSKETENGKTKSSQKPKEKNEENKNK